MAGDRRVLNIDVKLDDKGAQAKLAGIQKGGSSAAMAVFKGFVAANLSLAALNKTYQATLGFMKDSIQLSQVQLKAETQLAAALKAKGNYTVAAMQGLRDYTAEMQRQIGIGDEASMQIGAQIEALTGLSDVALQRAIKATAQLAEMQGMDLKASGLLVAKTIVSQTNALTRYGITIDMTKSGEERLQQLLDQTAAGWDMAKAKMNTYEGAMLNLNNSWGDLKETIGGFITKSPDIQTALRGIADAVIAINSALTDSPTAADNFGTAIGSAIIGIGEIGIQVARSLSAFTIQGGMRNIRAMSYLPGGANYGKEPPPDLFTGAEDALKLAREKLGFQYMGPENPSGWSSNVTAGAGAGTGGGKGRAAGSPSYTAMDTTLRMGGGSQPMWNAYSRAWGGDLLGQSRAIQQGIAGAAGMAGRRGPGLSNRWYANQRNQMDGWGWDGMSWDEVSSFTPQGPRTPWYRSQGAGMAAGAISGYQSGGIGGAIGALAGSVFGPLGSIAGGLLGGLFGGKKKREPVSVAQPIPVKVINFQDFGTAMLNVTKQARAGLSSFGIDRQSDLRLARRAAGV